MSDKKIPSPADALVTGMKNKAIKDNGGYLDEYKSKYVDHVMGNVIDILNNNFLLIIIIILQIKSKSGITPPSDFTKKK